MFAKAWIAILLGLLLGSLFFSGGCGWFGNGCSNNPYYYGQCGPVPASAVPAVAVPVTPGAGGWRAVPGSGAAPAATPIP